MEVGDEPDPETRGRTQPLDSRAQPVGRVLQPAFDTRVPILRRRWTRPLIVG